MQNNVQVNSKGRFEKGSHINLNSYNFTYNSTDWFSGYGDASYFDLTGGGKLIRPYSSNGSRTQNVILQDGTIKSLIIDVNSGSFGTNGALEIMLDTTAYADLGGASDFITSYLTVNVVDITGISYDVDFFYADIDVVGDEGLLSAQVYNAATWTEQGDLAAGSNNIYVTGLTDTAVISALTGSTGDLANLYISSAVTLMDTLAGYDTVIIQNGGVATAGESFQVKTLIVETGGELWTDNYVISGTNLRVEQDGLIGTQNTDGFDRSKGTSGALQFMSANINTLAIKYYNGTSLQDIGPIVQKYGSIGTIVVDNPAGIRFNNSPVNTSSGSSITFYDGKVTNSTLRVTNGPVYIYNYAGPDVLSGFSNIETRDVNSRKTLTLGGDSLIILPNLGIDKAVDIQIETDVVMPSLGDGYNRAHIYVNSNTLTFPANATIDDGSEFYITDTSVIVQEIDGTSKGKSFSYANYFSGSDKISFGFTLDSAIMGPNAQFIFKNIGKMHPAQPDVNYAVARYLDVDTLDVSDFSYDVVMTYLGSEVVGNESILEAAFYNGSIWDTTGAVLNTAGDSVSVNDLTIPAIISVGEIYALPLPDSISISPATGATLVATDALVYVLFDQPITAGSTIATISMTGTTSGALSGVTGTISDDTLMISHADFASVEDITVTVPAGAIANTEGKELNFDIIWTFQSESVGMQEIESKDIIIYPTKSTGIIKIKGAKGKTIEILNVLGSIVETEEAESALEVIDLTGKPGMYLIKIDDEVTKVIIQ
jgi:hypothetical protein